MKALNERSWQGRRFRIIPATACEGESRFHRHLATEAFKIYERRGCAPGHQAEDWKAAEGRIMQPLNCGFIAADDEILLATDSTHFGPGEIEIWVEPRRLILSGPEPVASAVGSPRGFIFRFVDLPVEIDPLNVVARFKGRMLEIELSSREPRIHTAKKAA